MSRYPCDTKVYVGDLGNHARKNELEDSFSYYGPLRSVWIARNPPGFAFVEFESARDAEDAVRGLDGRMICGRRARVEVSSGKSGRSYRGSKSGGGRRNNQGNLQWAAFFTYCLLLNFAFDCADPRKLQTAIFKSWRFEIDFLNFFFFLFYSIYSLIRRSVLWMWRSRTLCPRLPTPWTKP